MPGLILFRRRWAIAADDLVIPSILLMATHAVWGTMELMSFILIYHQQDECGQMLKVQTMGYFLMMCLAVCLEVSVACITMQGAIMDTKCRRKVRPVLYARCALFFAECGWMVFATVWLSHCNEHFPVSFTKAILLGTIIFNAVLLVVIFLGVYLSYDLGGSKWLKLRKYQANIQTTGSKLHHGSNHRTWRTRKTTRAYNESWDRRIRFLFCCLSTGQRTSLGEIAQLLSDFFRDLDLVPSDIVAGLVLLRRYQKLRRHALLAQNKTETYQFLSGAPISEETNFLKLTEPKVLKDYNQLVRYMRFSLAVYGWPMYVFRGKTCCKLLDVIPGLRCFCCFWLPQRIPGLDTEQDNCCNCNSSAMWAVMESVAEDEAIQFVHASYTGGVGVTPYFLALDHLEKKVVVTIRGTLSMKDLVTDLNASAEFIPVDPLQTNPPWLAHKGMILAAEYVKKKLSEDGKLRKLFEMAKAKTGISYDLLLVGHSLGGGTAAILAIMLREEFPTLKCICFSPPGGLLNLPAAEYTRSFVTTCLLGKDVVTRLGLHQLEAMRSDLLNVIQRSTCPKWKILLTSVFGRFFRSPAVDPAIQQYAQEQAANIGSLQGPRVVSPYVTTHPPMYLPGNIIQIVRRYPNKKQVNKTLSRFCCKKSQRKGEPIYQAIEVERESFYEISLSPSMVDDHMPDTLLSAMEKVLEYTAPTKPRRMQNGFGHPDDDTRTSDDSLSTPERAERTEVSTSTSTAPSHYESNLDLPYVDMSVTSPPTESPFNYASPGLVKKQSYVSHDSSDQSPYPSVKIYTSLVDQGTSSYTLGSSIASAGSFYNDVIQAEVYTDQPVHTDSRFLLSPDVRRSPQTSVGKAKSLTELRSTGGQNLRSQTNQQKSVSKEDLESTSSLQIPGRRSSRRDQRKYNSQEMLVGGSAGRPVANIRMKRSTVGCYPDDFHADASPPVMVSRSLGGSFSSLPEKTQYGTIYYV